MIECGPPAVVNGNSRVCQPRFQSRHRNLRHNDGIHLAGKSFDLLEQHIVVLLRIPRLEHLKGFAAQPGFDFDLASGFLCGQPQQPLREPSGFVFFDCAFGLLPAELAPRTKRRVLQRV